jgi:cytochrome c553
MTALFRILITTFVLATSLPGNVAAATAPASLQQPNVTNPILFVTQVPVPADFTTIGAVFGNHKASMSDVARGGDLWIRYPDGNLRNLTQAAGFGSTGQQGANAIAVRDPSVHWSGKKAVFSMVVGAPTQRYQVSTFYWQMYEVSGFGIGETVVITKVSNQPATFNNISPIYGTDERIIFTTDRPRNGAAHLYPQLDEYELAPTVSGLWSLDPTSGDLFMLDHAPSGDFTPTLDSFGRVIFTRWDHMQRDQQADGDAGAGCGSYTYGTFNYSDESASATFNLQNPDRTEVFPEPRSCRTDLLVGTNLNGHTFNQFFPWQILEDGTELETLNHLGRHELSGYFDVNFNNDPNLSYHHSQVPRTNPNTIVNMLHIKEDAARPGTYFAIDAPEFGTHASGQVISVTAAPALNPDLTVVGYVTHRDTSSTDDSPSANHSGLYRDPLPMSDGSLVAAHTFATLEDRNIGTGTAPKSRYDYRIKTLSKIGAYYTPAMTLTNGISKTVTWWDPDQLVTYSGNLWEWMPVEVRARPKPARLTAPLPAPETQMFTQAGVTVTELQIWLRQNNLALVITRNVTARDKADLQQPYNLRVPNGVQTVGASGKVYDVSYMQYFQADQLRGWTGCCSSTPNPGRRVLARPMHDPSAINNNPPVSSTVPAGSVVIAPDGSQAAFVPARRAMTWQLTDANGVGIVRERYWVTFQPGEIRTCTSCHGVNTKDQANAAAAGNAPQALLQLLQAWKQGQVPIVRDKNVYAPLVRR